MQENTTSAIQHTVKHTMEHTTPNIKQDTRHNMGHQALHHTESGYTTSNTQTCRLQHTIHHRNTVQHTTSKWIGCTSHFTPHSLKQTCRLHYTMDHSNTVQSTARHPNAPQGMHQPPATSHQPPHTLKHTTPPYKQQTRHNTIATTLQTTAHHTTPPGS